VEILIVVQSYPTCCLFVVFVVCCSNTVARCSITVYYYCCKRVELLHISRSRNRILGFVSFVRLLAIIRHVEYVLLSTVTLLVFCVYCSLLSTRTTYELSRNDSQFSDQDTMISLRTDSGKDSKPQKHNDK
jgi:hypothetical protein